MKNDSWRGRAAPRAAVALAFGFAAFGATAVLADSPDPVKIVTGLGGGSGSTVGPDGALYVTEPTSGEISRVNPKTGAVTTFATGLPQRMPGLHVGGAMDVEFLHGKAYVLVSLVGEDVGGTAVSAFIAWMGEAASRPWPISARFLSPTRRAPHSSCRRVCNMQWSGMATASS